MQNIFNYYLEINVPGVDFTKIEVDNVSSINANNHVYGLSVDYSLINILDNFVIKENDAIFDFGCGKGGTFPIFIKCGFKKIGGVELDKEIYDTLISNMNLLEIDTVGFYNCDATTLFDIIDDYNYFYMYDPFEGEIFEKVIQNIEESYYRKKREIFIIYTCPTCAKYIEKRKFCHVSKKIMTRFYGYKEAIIYKISEE